MQPVPIDNILNKLLVYSPTSLVYQYDLLFGSMETLYRTLPLPSRLGITTFELIGHLPISDFVEEEGIFTYTLDPLVDIIFNLVARDEKGEEIGYLASGVDNKRIPLGTRILLSALTHTPVKIVVPSGVGVVKVWCKAGILGDEIKNRIGSTIVNLGGYRYERGILFHCDR